MAEIKNYVSKYSGDQLDAAIAVLGSLETMFFSQDDFKDFKAKFDEKMTNLKGEVEKVLSSVTIRSVYYDPIEEQSNNG